MRDQLLCRGPRRVEGQQSGQALVETVIVIPLMIFLILGVLQLVMMQHARIMTEYAAFNAARAGIVWNADRTIMENAATVALLPSYEGLSEESGLDSPEALLKGIIQRALVYQATRALTASIGLVRDGVGGLLSQIPGTGAVDDYVKMDDFLKQGTDQLLGIAENAAELAAQGGLNAILGEEDRMVTVETLSPRLGLLGGVNLGLGLPGVEDFGIGIPEDYLPGVAGGSFRAGQAEIDFDDPKNRGATRLTIRVRYLYMLRVPFANWIVHQAWLAGRAGRRLYGAVWNPQQAPGETGFRQRSPASRGGSDELSNKLAGLAGQGIYMVPLTATYTMRMQSNPYKSSVMLK